MNSETGNTDLMCDFATRAHSMTCIIECEWAITESKQVSASHVSQHVAVPIADPAEDEIHAQIQLYLKSHMANAATSFVLVALGLAR